MSAFVIDTNTMDRCVRTIMGNGRYGTFCNTFGTGSAEWIGRQLFEMNIEAVMQRYPDCRDTPDNMPGWQGCETMAETYQAPRLASGRLMRPALCDGYKALTCLRYQCSEGNVTETVLYKKLCECIADVANEIVTGLPEYDAAVWG